MGIMAKWYTTGNQRSYALYKDSNNNFVFSISDDGTAVASISDLANNFGEEKWYYVVGRFTPSEELALFVNGKWYTNTDSIPASIFNGSESLDFGRYNRTNYLNGRLSHAFLSADAIDDYFIEVMYAHAKPLFVHKQVSSSSSSTSSTSSSSSSSSTSSSSSPPP